MIRFAFALAMIVAVVVPAAAESIVTGRDGKVIRLKDDGSWEYVLDAAGNPVRRPEPLGSAGASAIRRISRKPLRPTAVFVAKGKFRWLIKP